MPPRGPVPAGRGAGEPEILRERGQVLAILLGVIPEQPKRFVLDGAVDGPVEVDRAGLEVFELGDGVLGGDSRVALGPEGFEHAPLPRGGARGASRRVGAANSKSGQRAEAARWTVTLVAADARELDGSTGIEEDGGHGVSRLVPRDPDASGTDGVEVEDPLRLVRLLANSTAHPERRCAPQLRPTELFLALHGDSPAPYALADPSAQIPALVRAADEALVQTVGGLRTAAVLKTGKWKRLERSLACRAARRPILRLPTLCAGILEHASPVRHPCGVH